MFEDVLTWVTSQLFCYLIYLRVCEPAHSYEHIVITFLCTYFNPTCCNRLKAKMRRPRGTLQNIIIWQNKRHQYKKNLIASSMGVTLISLELSNRSHTLKAANFERQTHSHHTVSLNTNFKLVLSRKAVHNQSASLTVSFSLSIADSSLDWDGVWMGVWTGVFGVECPLVAFSAIAFFFFVFFFYNTPSQDKSGDNVIQGMSMTMTPGHSQRLCIYVLSDIIICHQSPL